ncbi:hypothetical protein ACOME3_004413 [Neoechinorhynchus agilis]
MIVQKQYSIDRVRFTLAYVLTRFIIDGLLVANPILAKRVQSEMNSTITGSMMHSSLVHLIILIAGPTVVPIINRIGCRTCSLIGVLMAFIAIVLSITASSTFTFSYLFGIIGGTGLALWYYSVDAAVGLYVNNSLANATNYGLLSSSIGCIIVPIFIKWIASDFYWTSTLLLIAGLIFHGLIPTVLIGRPHVRNRLARRFDDINNGFHLTNKYRIIPDTFYLFSEYGTSTSRIKIYISRTSEFFFAAAFYSHLHFIPCLAESRNSFEKNVVFISPLVHLCATGMFMVASKISINWIICEYQTRPVCVTAFAQCVLGIIATFVRNVRSSSVLLLYTICNGICTGTTFVCMAASIDEIVDGADCFDEVSICLAFRGIGAIVGTALTGLSIQSTGNQELLLAVVPICCAISSSLNLVVWALRSKDL